MASASSSGKALLRGERAEYEAGGKQADDDRRYRDHAVAQSRGDES